MVNDIGDNSLIGLWRTIAEVHKLMHLVRQEELKKFGISPMQSFILDCIKRNGGTATGIQLARWAIRTPQSVSGILSRMERQGLLIKTRDLKQKNVVKVSLTEKGEELYCKSIKSEAIRKILSSLSEN